MNLILISCLLLAACGGTSVGQLSRATPPSSPRRLATPRATPASAVATTATRVAPSASSQASPPVAAGWPEQALPKLATALAPDGVPGDLIQLPGTPYAYGINVPDPPFESPTPAPIPRSGRLERVDLASQQVALGPTVAADAQLITIGASVYLFSPQGMAANGEDVGPYSLRAIEGSSLGTPVSLRSLSSSGGFLFATSNPPLPNHGLWLATATQNDPSHLWLIDSLTGSILQEKTFTGVIRSLDPSPDGKRLYLARFTQPWYQATPSATPSATPDSRIFGNASSSFQVIPVGSGYFPPYFFIDELDARTGRLLVDSGQELIVNAGGVDAVDGGVWVGVSYGMGRGTYLLRESDLKRIAEPTYVPKVLNRDNEAMPTGGSWTGSIFWLESEAGLSCFNPDTGVELAGMTFPYHDGQYTGQLTPVASWDGWVYALVDNATNGSASLVALNAPAACNE